MARRGTGGDSRGTRPGAAAAAAADLYGLPLDEFITARTELARRARADGDRAAAAAIGRLPKPSVVAWLANQLARQHGDEIQSVLKLGAALRAATADLDAAALRQLSGQQHQVLSALVGRAREVGAAAGQAVSDSTARGLEDTLHAALADEAAARQLTEGQLAAGLSRTGFPGIDADAADTAAAWATPPRKRSGPATTAEARTAKAAETTKAEAAEARRAKAAEAAARAAEAAAEARRQQLGRARQAEAQARRDARDAARDREQAQAALTQAEADSRRAAGTVSRLQDELGAALAAQNDAAGAQRRARAEADRAGRTARQADRRLAAAAGRRADLERER